MLRAMGSRLKVLTVFGTRPEAIKLFPLLHMLGADDRFESRICVTGQHRELLDQVLALATISPHHDLALMQPGQSLDALAARMLGGLGEVMGAEQPDMVVVQGDTTSAFVAALAAHYRRIPVIHVEAGLRSGNLRHPWPEEFNRKAIGTVAALHCAPTQGSVDALLAENVPSSTIHLTGNTGVDALLWMAARLDADPQLAQHMGTLLKACADKRIVGVTCHRRENFDGGAERIAAALAQLAQREDVAIVFPLHPNPAVCEPMRQHLGAIANIHLVEPLTYPEFTALLRACHLILSDSGGVQEEAPTFGVPVLVLREATERPEGLAAGTARLVGTDTNRIVAEATRLLDDPTAHAAMSTAHNPYGDGEASARIVELLAQRNFDKLWPFASQMRVASN